MNSEALRTWKDDIRSPPNPTAQSTHSQYRKEKDDVCAEKMASIIWPFQSKVHGQVLN